TPAGFLLLAWPLLRVRALAPTRGGPPTRGQKRITLSIPNFSRNRNGPLTFGIIRRVEFRPACEGFAMRSITRLFSAFGTLADSILTLANVVDTATAKLRLQIANESETPTLPHHGDVIDGDTTPAKGRKAKA